jgi:protein-L-isoaspartate(D-aspartate) O-methyltransferase
VIPTLSIPSRQGAHHKKEAERAKRLRRKLDGTPVVEINLSDRPLSALVHTLLMVHGSFWLAMMLATGTAWCCSGGRAMQQTAADTDSERARMVDQQLRARDIDSPRVLDAMRVIPRHLFVPEALQAEAYRDTPVPIGFDQTISQPYIVAFMTQALQVEPGHRVLEIGTGSGYQAAVLSLLTRDVYTIEIIPPLAERARQRLSTLGYANIHVREGNGYDGWPEHAPYDRIIVTAAPDDLPPALVEQLAVGGIMAIPVGTAAQELRVLRRSASGMETLRTLPVRFVPMTGKPVR